MIAEPLSTSQRFRVSLDDRINPIVVKELRQAVQSRFVTAALMALLMIQVLAIGLYLLSSGDLTFDFDSGRNIFLLLFGILLAIGMIFIPLYTAVRMAAERSDTNVDLLFITTLKPRSIIAGKMVSAIVLAVLLFSACMPFMTFTYFLRGIDLPTIFASLGFGFLVVIGCAQAALLVASLPANRAFKVILGIISLIMFGIAYISTMTWVGGLVMRGSLLGASPSDFWLAMVILLTIIVFLGGLFYMLSIAMIKPIAANRALPLRVFITLSWIVIGAAAFADSAIEKVHAPVTAWNVFFNIVFACTFFASVSERDAYGRRLLRSVPQSTPIRIASFPFFSGAANGLIWGMGMTLLTLGTVWGWAKSFRTYSGLGDLIESAKWMGGMSLYFFCYAMSASLLRRVLLKKVPQEFTWLIGAILLALGSTMPIVAGYLLFFNENRLGEDFGRWLVGNPFAWSFKAHRVFYASVGAVWAALAAVLSLGWLRGRFKQFRPISGNE